MSVPDMTPPEPAPPSPAQRRRWLTRRRFLAGSALAVAGLTPPTLWETHRILLSRHTVSLPHLPPETPAFRIVQVSDLHRSAVVSEEMIHRAVTLANAQNADLVLLTGDFVTHDPDYILSCADILKELHAPLGVYAILGNHDYSSREPDRVVRVLGQHGIRTLVNENTRLENGVNLVGVDDFICGHPNLPRSLWGVSPASPVLLMAHNPRHIVPIARDCTEYACLVLSGHTHGRQINLPGSGLVLGHSYPYVSGWFERGSMKMYVNRGIGVVGIPFRWFAPPEVTVFDVVSNTVKG